MCRETLVELIEFVGYYKKALGTADIDERFDLLMSRVSRRSPAWAGSDTEGIELVHEPYTRPFDEEPLLAAATAGHEREPLRFCSRDGRYVLREFPSLTAGGPSFFLVGDKGTRTGGVEVVVDGVRFTTDENGLLEGDSDGPTISKDSRIHVRPED